VAALGAGLLFGTLVLATGTRQYAVAIGAGMLMVVQLVGGSRGAPRIWTVLVGTALLIGALLLLTGERKSVLRERFGADMLAYERGMGRGAIWREAFYEAVSNPLLGVGFKNFGQEVASFNRFTGEVEVMRDSAHGLFQDVFVEHGAVLGAGLLIGTCMLIYAAMPIRRASSKKPLKSRVLDGLLIAQTVPLLFSGAFCDATAIYLLLVREWIGDAQRMLDQLGGAPIAASQDEQMRPATHRPGQPWAEAPGTGEAIS
jgi:O-antigen ligase